MCVTLSVEYIIAGASLDKHMKPGYLVEAVPRPSLKVVQALLTQHHQRHVTGMVVFLVKRQELVARVNALPNETATYCTPRVGQRQGETGVRGRDGCSKNTPKHIYWEGMVTMRPRAGIK